MAQTTIQGSFLGDATVTGAKIGADFISAQTALTTGLSTTDEIIVSDAGVIKRMDISVLEIAATQITANGTLPVLNGSNLTTLPAANLTGTLPAISGVNLTALVAGNITAGGTFLAQDGSALTALNATQLTSGTMPDARFPATLPALNGAALTALNGTQITSGTVPVAQLGSSGTRSSSTFLNGANAWAAAGAALSSQVVIVARTQAQGTGTQSITGAGFNPTAAIIFAHEGSSPNTSACWAFIDSDGAEGKISRPETGIYRNLSSGTELIEITDQTADGMSGAGTLITDGLSIVWTKYGAGQLVNMSILFLR